MYFCKIIDNLEVLLNVRTFLSLNLDDSVRERISVIQDKLRFELKGHNIKWENPEKMHLTLRFLGNIDEDRVDSLAGKLAKIEAGFSEIGFETGGIGFFPNAKRPNVVFVQLCESGNRSGILVKHIDSVILDFGITPDKDFVPHITLGRFRKEGRMPVAGVTLTDPEKFAVSFGSFFLMKSVMDFRGSTYSVVREFKFIVNS